MWLYKGDNGEVKKLLLIEIYASCYTCKLKDFIIVR